MGRKTFQLGLEHGATGEMPGLDVVVFSTTLRPADYPKLKIALERVDDLIQRVEKAEEDHEDVQLSAEERKFYDAYSEHWVHADKRTILTQYLCKQFDRALRS